MSESISQDIRDFISDSNRLASFEGRIGELEKVCLAECPHGWIGSKAEPASRRWFAIKILYSIKAVRDLLVRGDALGAASEAVEVGALAMEAESRQLLVGDASWRSFRSKQRERANKATATRSDKKARFDQRLREAALAVQVQEPSISIRAIAARLRKDFRMKCEGRENQIEALRKRLVRLGIRK